MEFMRTLATFFTVFMASGVHSAENLVPFPSHLLPTGTVLNYEFDNGQKSTRRVLSNDENGIEILLRGSSKDPFYESVQVLDQNGLVIRIEEKGEDSNYEPHNCVRVIGECSFTISNRDGDTYLRNYTSTFEENLLIAEVTNEKGEIIWTYRILYNAEGLFLNATVQNRSKTPTVTKLINITPPSN